MQSNPPSAALPEKPLVIIEPSKSWVALNLTDLWAYRDLLYFLMWRDLKVRYKQTVLGVTWVVMQPVLTTLIFTIFLGRLARVPSEGIPYPIFAYAGLLPWTFFSNSVGSTSNSIIGSANLVTKVYFPRMLIPGAAIAARLVDFFIAFVILALLLFYYGIAVTWNILMVPPLISLITMLALAAGMLSSALNVKYRDVGVLVPVLLQIGTFVSPVLYPAKLVPVEWHWLYFLNPLAGIIEAFRASFFGRQFNWSALAFSALTTFLFLIYAAYTFRRVEKSFADVV